jgi:hypothetical protein
MELSVSLDVVCRLIVRARDLEEDAPAVEADEDEEAQETDDDLSVAEDDDANEAVEAELIAILDDLNDDQIAEILALAWVGRGTYDASEWEDALEEASDSSGDDAVDQLLEMPTLAAYLDAGLAAFDLSCEGAGQLD